MKQAPRPVPLASPLCDPSAPMAKPNPKQILRVAGNYLKAHPEEIWRVVKGVASQRIGVPMDALRYLVSEFATGEKAQEARINRGRQHRPAHLQEPRAQGARGLRLR